MEVKQRVLAMVRKNPDASSGWIAAQVGCHPAYVRTVLYRSGMVCAKQPAKTGRDITRGQTMLREASRLRRRAKELEARALDLEAKASALKSSDPLGDGP
jgi:hypothetical protein